MEELYNLLYDESIVEESTTSEVESRMELIYDNIKILKTRLNEAIEDEDENRIKKICDNGIKSLREYYRQIESIPESAWENIGEKIFNKLSFIISFGINTASFMIELNNPNKQNKFIKQGIAGSQMFLTLYNELKSRKDEINYKKINDKNLGNKERKAGGNRSKEKALKIINDNINLIEKVRKSLN